MSKKNAVELVSVTVKINGNVVVLDKKDCSFSGWEQECECCGSHSGCDMTFMYDKKSYGVTLD